VGPGVTVYGNRDEKGILILGLDALTEADDELLGEAFDKIHASHGLMLVDWLSQSIVTGVSKSGELEFWKP